MSESKIIRKMKKLLALTESGNEHEAMSATRQLHAMLAKHNVSMSSLNEEEETVGQDYEVVTNKPWKRQVGKCIANLYFCEFYFDDYGKKKSAYYFVGTESNRQFALHIFKMVVKTVEQESRRECTKQYGKRNSSFTNSFRVGAMVRIRERCNELIGDAKRGELEDEDGSLLPALLSVYETQQFNCKAWLSKNTNLVTKPCRANANNSQGYSAGQVTGGRVQLSRAIQSKSSPKLIGA